MATLALGIAGAVVGSAFGNPMLGFSIGTAIGSMIDAPRVPGQEVGKVDDLHVSGSSYGTAIPVVWGGGRLAANLIWATDLVLHQTTQHHGKGGGPSTKTDTYSVSCQALVCAAGRNARVTRVWGDDLVLWEAGYSGNLVTPRFLSGDESQNADVLVAANPGSGFAAGQTPACRGQLTFVLQDLPLQNFSNRLPNLSVEVATDPVSLADVLGDLCLMAGLTTDDFDFSGASAQMVTGYVLQSRQSAAEAIKPLLASYFYDLVESDGLLRAVPRGGAPLLTVSAGDLGASTGGAGEVMRISEKRTQEAEMPYRVDVTYYNAAKDYQKALQGAVCQTATGQDAQSISLPLALLDADAQGVAMRLLQDARAQRAPLTFALPPRYLQVTPADVLLVPLTHIDNTVSMARVRITSVDLALPGEIHFEAVTDDDGVLVQAGIASAAPPPVRTYLAAVPTQFYAWSGKELQDADQAAPGFYVAATGPGGWHGAAVWYSADNGNSYLPAGTVSQRSVLGTAGVALADGAPGAFDSANSLAVTLSAGGALATTTEAQVSQGVNAALVGGELLGFATATLTAPEAYTLTDLLRGGRGSQASGHAAGEPFVLLTPAVLRVPVNATLAGQTVLVKCVSDYQQLSDVAAQPVVIAARTPTAVEQHVTAVEAQAAAQGAAISALQGQVNALPRPVPTPFYRISGYPSSRRASGDTLDDSYFDGGANVPSGALQTKWTHYASGPGGSLWLTGFEAWALRCKMGLKNTTGAAISVPIAAPIVDDYVKLTWAGATVYETQSTNGVPTTAGPATLTIAAGQSGVLTIYYYNRQGGSGTDSGNPMALRVLHDALIAAGVAFVDAGP